MTQKLPFLPISPYLLIGFCYCFFKSRFMFFYYDYLVKVLRKICFARFLSKTCPFWPKNCFNTFFSQKFTILTEKCSFGPLSHNNILIGISLAEVWAGAGDHRKDGLLLNIFLPIFGPLLTKDFDIFHIDTIFVAFTIITLFLELSFWHDNF